MEPTKEEIKAAKRALRKEKIALHRQTINEKWAELKAKKEAEKNVLLAKIEELKNN